MIAQEAANIIAKNGNISINSQSGDIHVKADSGNYHKDVGQKIYMQSGTSSPDNGENAQGSQGSAVAANQTTPVSAETAIKNLA
jgi:hypothetical protein